MVDSLYNTYIHLHVYWMISPDHDIAVYVQVVIIKRETRVQLTYHLCKDTFLKLTYISVRLSLHIIF